MISAGASLFSGHVLPPNLKSLVGRIAPRAVLFIYGEHDQSNLREQFYFTEQLWPEFDEVALDTAIISYRQRERRYGRTSEQLFTDAPVTQTTVPHDA